jgi:N-acetylglucosaminyldiphosphoundecaprenol N-acetyl-beta-D-mannosaminyltransferase
LISARQFLIGGLVFHEISYGGLIEASVNSVDYSNSVFFISTPNLNFLITAQADVLFQRSVTVSNLSIPDGFPIVLIARILGLPMPARIAGSTFFQILRQQDTGLGRPWKIYFFGGQPGIAKQAAAVLNSDGRHMVCVGFHEAGFGSVEEMSDPAVIDEINRSGADFLVVALGAKKGQAWIVHNLDRLKVPIVSHLGAVINFVAGNVRRAPLFWQRLGMEWLWRIKEEPTLWRRYWSDGLALCRLMVTQILPAAANERWKRPAAMAFEDATVECFQADQKIVLRLVGAWGRENLSRLQSTAVLVKQDCLLDLAGVTYIDSMALGSLLALEGALGRGGFSFTVESVDTRLRKALGHYGLKNWHRD